MAGCLPAWVRSWKSLPASQDAPFGASHRRGAAAFAYRATRWCSPTSLCRNPKHAQNHDEGTVTLQALANSLPFIRYSHSSTLGVRVERVLRYNAIDSPRKLEVDHADTLTLLVSQGLGWAITTPTCLLQTGTRFVDTIDLIPIAFATIK
ncbi:LysR substrate-binding domain-containing protein [Paraburkholderia sp. SIMBA_054]|uniref:LysR substrate-binding domain-containing protein n=1 Tax=Paraburkholderia sp. SIMBA_054 TaxID=3085795 RepID=UPI00397A0632